MSTPAAAAHSSAANDAVRVIETLGPGLITGAADDDPSGIATYSQAGAQFGPNLLWTVVLSFPMMVAIQSVSARVGAVTGKGLAGNMKRVFPAWFLNLAVGLLLLANTVNITADVAAMGAAAKLIAPWFDVHVYIVGLGLASLLLQVFLSYEKYVGVLKWLTLALLAYVAVVFTVKIPWWRVAYQTLLPHFAINKDSITMIVAVFGTTISPYLFFWQSSQEVEEMEAHGGGVSLGGSLRKRTRARLARIRKEIKRIGADTIVGMGFSNLIAFFIILTAAYTLNTAHVTNIASAAEAAQALKPIAGDFAFLIFSLGIIGTGLLAIPVLAGSAAYAVAETRGWEQGLSRKLLEAKGFYAIIAIAVLGGVALGFAPIDPMKALVFSAVINGVTAVPIMAATMIIATREKIMGKLIATPMQRLFGWIATAFMGAAAVAMLATMAM